MNSELIHDVLLQLLLSEYFGLDQPVSPGWGDQIDRKMTELAERVEIPERDIRMFILEFLPNFPETS